MMHLSFGYIIVDEFPAVFQGIYLDRPQKGNEFVSLAFPGNFFFCSDVYGGGILLKFCLQRRIHEA